MRRMPARLSPSTISVAPPMTRRVGQHVDQALREVRGGHAEEREDGGEAGHEREGVAHRQPAARDRGLGLSAGDRDRAQLPEIRGHERRGRTATGS